MITKILPKNQLNIGDRFGMLEVISEPIQTLDGKKPVRGYICRCDCGTELPFVACELTRGRRKSCGCLIKRDQNRDPYRNHPHYKRIFSIWKNMLNRCDINNEDIFPRYAGRGIRVCDEWVTNFDNFFCWATSSGYSKELTIDREDNDGNYDPKNCRWATTEQQVNNKSNNIKITAFGETKTAKAWSRDVRCVVGDWSLRNRIRLGMPHEEAITTPPAPGNRSSCPNKE